ncbi:MAG TPA: hypothetical protein VN840_00125 [Streptosporangiaceae bacterium]|nr:hypothetical protein [Streptosporangiaceae bacterium]
MSESDAVPLPREGEVFFDVRGAARSMRLSWYAESRVAVFSIWQGDRCTGTFRLPFKDLARMAETLQRGPQPGPAGRGPAQPVRAGSNMPSQVPAFPEPNGFQPPDGLQGYSGYAEPGSYPRHSSYPAHATRRESGSFPVTSGSPADGDFLAATGHRASGEHRLAGDRRAATGYPVTGSYQDHGGYPDPAARPDHTASLDHASLDHASLDHAAFPDGGDYPGDAAYHGHAVRRDQTGYPEQGGPPERAAYYSAAGGRSDPYRETYSDPVGDTYGDAPGYPRYADSASRNRAAMYPAGRHDTGGPGHEVRAGLPDYTSTQGNARRYTDDRPYADPRDQAGLPGHGQGRDREYQRPGEIPVHVPASATPGFRANPAERGYDEVALAGHRQPARALAADPGREGWMAAPTMSGTWSGTDAELTGGPEAGTADFPSVPARNGPPARDRGAHTGY